MYQIAEYQKPWIPTPDAIKSIFHFISVQFSRSVVSDSLRPHESQYSRPPCPSSTSTRWVGSFQQVVYSFCASVFSPVKWRSVQINSVAQSGPTLCNPMNRSTPGLPVHHQLPEFTQTHVHRVSDAIQPSHSLSSSSPPAPNHSQHQSLFQ